MPMEYLVPSLHNASLTKLSHSGVEVERMSQLLELEEDRFIAWFHEQVQKAREKARRDRNIKHKFQSGDLVLLYDKFLKHPGKFRMH